MPQILSPGITVGEGAAQSQPIQAAATDVTAFVGRALRGPVDTPVEISSFEDYRRVFGGLWAASPMSYAVRLFFINGGRHALVVRVVRNAACATLTLPAGDQAMTLVAVAPGRHDALRAAVDYDRIDDARRFNLTLQRVKGFGSEHVVAQEIYSAVIADAEDERFVGRALERSQIARLGYELPARRPDPTLRNGATGTALFLDANLDGSDGDRLSDRDLLGSSETGSGLMALRRSTHFGQLYLPPATEADDVGVAVLRAAARLCDKRHALLIVDAPRHWRSPNDVLMKFKRFSLRSISAALYYPWVWVDDPATGKQICLPPGGAVAGFLARTVLESGVSSAPAGNGAVLRGLRRLAERVDERDSYLLARDGINTLRTGRGGRKLVWDARTLADPARHAPHWQSLRVRRLMLYLKESIENGTRWAAFEPNAAPLWTRLTEQVTEFLQRSFEAGLFRGTTAQTAYFVKCDREINPLSSRRAGEVRMRIGFAPVTASRFVTFLIRQSAAPFTSGE